MKLVVAVALAPLGVFVGILEEATGAALLGDVLRAIGIEGVARKRVAIPGFGIGRMQDISLG